MKASVIIPTYNHCDEFLKPCLQSIIDFTDLNDLEIIVVANGCTDNTREYVESLGSPFKLVWFDEGLGYTKATNEGVKVSTGEVIILMNNDVVLLPQPKNEWLDFLLKPLKDQVGITCNLKIWDSSVERMFAVGFLMAFPRHIWNQAGPFDESWTPGGGEDIEFCIKVEQLGYKIIQVPDEHNEIVGDINVNRFMSYHKGEGTVMDDVNNKNDKWVKHIADVRAKLEHKYKLPSGWFYGEDINEYRRLVEAMPTNGVLCELGTYKGRSLCSVSDIIKRKNIKVHAVDIFTGTVSEGHREPDYQAEFESNLERFGIRDQVTVYKMTTDEAVSLFDTNEIDLLFLDADHEYGAVKNDIDKWASKVRGTFSGHDYGTHIGVAKAVNEKWSNVRVHGYVWSKNLS